VNELELILKTSVIVNDLKALQETCNQARVAMAEAAAEIQSLRSENELLRARLRIQDLRLERRAEFDLSANAPLRPQA
jgi:hypothetical protein